MNEPARALPPVASVPLDAPPLASLSPSGSPAAPPTLEVPIAYEGDFATEPAGSTLPGLRVRAQGPDPIALVQRYLDPNQDNAAARDELIRLGEGAMQAIMARFPGPMRVDPHRARLELPPASRSGPLLSLLVAIGRPSVPFLTVRSTSGDPDVRFWATHLFAELPFAESSQAVLVRLFDDDVAVRRAARRAAAALIAAGPSTEAPLFPALERLARASSERLPRRLAAIETLGELTLPKAVPVLIAALADPASEVADAAHRALVQVTRQDFRRDARKWVDWWTANASRHRVEWLIDALVHESPTLRSAAAEELAPLVGRDFGYYDDLPADEREVAQARYLIWWEHERAARKKRST